MSYIYNVCIYVIYIIIYIYTHGIVLPSKNVSFLAPMLRDQLEMGIPPVLIQSWMTNHSIETGKKGLVLGISIETETTIFLHSKRCLFESNCHWGILKTPGLSILTHPSFLLKIDGADMQRLDQPQPHVPHVYSIVLYCLPYRN